MYIDTHCHIDTDGASDYIENARKANVNILINASEDYNTSLESVSLSERFLNVYSCVGVHPLNVLSYDNDISKFVALISNEKVKAIGEIGLDYYYGTDTKERQKEVFKSFLSLAEKANLPVVIHSRDAVMDTINILKEYKVRGVIHCFSGSLEVAREYIKMGFYLGIGGVLTFKNSKLYEVIKQIGLDRIILETDAPFLTPEPYRGKRNESKYIPIIAKRVASILEVDESVVMDVTTSNARRVFDI